MSLQDPFAGNLLEGWAVNAPKGVTKRGNLHKFQEDTVDHLYETATEIAQQAYEDLIVAMNKTFQQGTSEETGYAAAVDTLDYNISKSERGVKVEFKLDAPHSRFMTALKGGPVDGMRIVPRGSTAGRKGARLIFYWKDPGEYGPPGVYIFKAVNWKPRLRKPGEDPIMETLSRYTNDFAVAMLDAHSRAWVDFMQERVQYGYGGRSTRVG